MTHMKNNPFFPRGIKQGDRLKVRDPNDKIITIIVSGIWYPEEHPVWNESVEIPLMGYCGSSPDKPFPQIISYESPDVQLSPNGMRFKMFGDDWRDILEINDRPCHETS